MNNVNPDNIYRGVARQADIQNAIEHVETHYDTAQTITGTHYTIKQLLRDLRFLYTNYKHPQTYTAKDQHELLTLLDNIPPQVRFAIVIVMEKATTGQVRATIEEEYNISNKFSDCDDKDLVQQL